MPRPVRAVACLAAAIVVTITATGSAHASAFRYWTYWRGDDGSWTFSSAGPAFVIPQDGDVDGWRFGISTEAGSAAGAPATEPSFDAVCGDMVAPEGQKRVALIIDPGSVAQAPPAQSPPPSVTTCVVIAGDATGYDVLRSVTTVRVNDKGLVCGVGGYPTGECAPVLSDDEVAAITAAGGSAPPVSVTLTDEQASAIADSSLASGFTPDAGSGTPWPTIGVIAIALGLVGVLMWRRRRA